MDHSEPLPDARPPTRVRDLWRTRRNRLLASPRFQRWAAAFPLTRGIARRRAKSLFDLCAGFVYAQALSACVRLDLFRILAEGPQRVDTLAGRLGLPRDGAERLLRAAVALDLAERAGDDLYALGPQGAVVLGNPGIAAMVEHHAMLYADLADPVALLRGRREATELARYWPYANTDDPGALPEERVAAYSRLMASSQPMVAAEAVQAYPLRRHTRLLDVGGGEGVFLQTVAEAAPKLELMLFDLPAVTGRARRRLRQQGLSGRVTTHGGDFFADPLPGGLDAVSLVRVIYDHDDAMARRILARAHAALPPGGRLILAEPMAGSPGAERAGAYFSFYLRAMESGRARSFDALAALAAEVGFTRIRRRPTARPLLCGVLEARVSG